MWIDPIVEEVRAHRDEIAREAGNDLHRICEQARQEEAKHTERIVSPIPSPSVSVQGKVEGKPAAE